MVICVPVPVQGMQDGWMLVLTAAILCDPLNHEAPVLDEKTAMFYVAAELNVRYPFLLETKY